MTLDPTFYVNIYGHSFSHYFRIIILYYLFYNFKLIWGPARGQAHIRVSCPHFPHWRSGDVVLLSHMATCYVSLLQPCKPPHPDIPSSQHQRASLLSATTSPPSTYRRKSALRLVHKPALNLGLRFQNLPPTPELPVTSSQLNRGGTLS